MEIKGQHNSRVVVLEHPQAVCQKAAELVTDLAAHAIKTSGRFTIALSGGSTPKALYELLATDKYRQIISWEKVFVFWGDERCVAPDHTDSNYRMVCNALLSKVPIPEANIFKMYNGSDQPIAAAAAYAQTLIHFFGLAAGEIPSFDLILLGLGADGHTASLFPDTPAVSEKKLLVTAIYVSTLSSYRLTLTVPLLNAAAHTIFLVTGDSKAGVLYNLVTNKDTLPPIPAQLVQPSGELWVLADTAAGYLLK